MCLLNLLGGKFNDRAEITIGLTCVGGELLLVVGCWLYSLVRCCRNNNRSHFSARRIVVVAVVVVVVCRWHPLKQ